VPPYCIPPTGPSSGKHVGSLRNVTSPGDTWSTWILHPMSAARVPTALTSPPAEMHRMLNELKWFDTYIKKTPATTTSVRR